MGKITHVNTRNLHSIVLKTTRTGIQAMSVHPCRVVLHGLRDLNITFSGETANYNTLLCNGSSFDLRGQLLHHKGHVM